MSEKYLKTYVEKTITSSFLKPNATISDVITQAKKETLTKNDFLVLLCGTNDRNPEIFQIKLNLWLNSVSHTNVIVGETPYNVYLNEQKLNYTLKFICSRFSNVLFMDMNYSRFKPSRRNLALYTACSLLKEIIRLEYRFKFEKYQLSQLTNSRKHFENKSTQTYEETNILCSADYINRSNSTDSNDNCELNDEAEKGAEINSHCNDLFRV